jgi:hypothetical protein
MWLRIFSSRFKPIKRSKRRKRGGGEKELNKLKRESPQTTSFWTTTRRSLIIKGVKPRERTRRICHKFKQKEIDL